MIYSSLRKPLMAGSFEPAARLSTPLLSLQYLINTLADIERELRDRWMENATETKKKIGDDALIDAWHQCRLDTVDVFITRLQAKILGEGRT